MRRTILVVLLAATPGFAANELRAGWTPDALGKETADCTEELVQGAWDNTERSQGVEPSKPLTPEIRAELAPQIAAMKKLCGCAVREGAKRYTKAEADRAPKDLEAFVAGTIARGICQLEQ